MNWVRKALRGIDGALLRVADGDAFMHRCVRVVAAVAVVAAALLYIISRM